jgi:uncharacterized membrane protein
MQNLSLERGFYLWGPRVVPDWLGPLCSFLSSVTWTIGSANYSRLSREYSVFAINFSRAFFALPLFAVAVFVTHGGWVGGVSALASIRSSHVGWLTLSMVASYGLGDALFLWSTRSLGVPGALAIASAYPIWTALAGLIFKNSAITISQGSGMLLTLAGVVLVILNAPSKIAGTVDHARLLNRWVGVLLAVITSVLWALNNYAISRGGVDLSAPVGNVVRMVLAMSISFGFGRLFAPKTSFVLPPRVFMGMAWLFVLEAFGGSYFFFYGLVHSPLIIAATLSSLAPVLGVPVAWLLGLEKISWARTLGVGLVVTGLWILMGISI